MVANAYDFYELFNSERFEIDIAMRVFENAKLPEAYFHQS